MSYQFKHLLFKHSYSPFFGFTFFLFLASTFICLPSSPVHLLIITTLLVYVCLAFFLSVSSSFFYFYCGSSLIIDRKFFYIEEGYFFQSFSNSFSIEVDTISLYCYYDCDCSFFSALSRVKEKLLHKRPMSWLGQSLLQETK